MLRQLRLQNYRCFNDCTFAFEKATVVVGKNNAGKSTLVEALELVSTVVNRKAVSFGYPPGWLDVPKFSRCIAPSISHLDLDVATVFHRYGDPPAKIVATFEGGVTITIYVGEERTIYATVETKSDWVRSSGQFMGLSLPWLHVLPQVAPLVSNENLLTEDYIEQNLYTRLSSRHFRNQIFRSSESFPDFKGLAESTWHGLRVQNVERKTAKGGSTLSMLVRDGNFVAEAAWMGHGLQMWLQIIWFVSRTTPNCTVVLDEPDVYMHPDLQRKLFRLLRSRFAQCIVATHSVEIMAEADPSEILIVDKSQRRSRFANSEPGVQLLIDQIGGVHNVHLARLWSAKKFLMVEGKDMTLLRQFHSLIFPDAEIPLDGLPNFPVGGWGGWSYAIGSSMALKNAVGDLIVAYCILDSDYHTPKEKNERLQEAEKRGVHLHVWSRKEIENYLLNPQAIRRLIVGRMKQGVPPTAEEIKAKLLEFCEDEKETVLDGIVAGLMAENHGLGAGANKIARAQLAPQWEDPNKRLTLVSGKSLLSDISAWSQKKFEVSFGASAVAKKFHANEVPQEVVSVLQAIEEGEAFPSD
jgi:energy-coupling factor transporter ATP-binding protein EcfA2